MTSFPLSLPTLHCTESKRGEGEVCVCVLRDREGKQANKPTTTTRERGCSAKVRLSNSRKWILSTPSERDIITSKSAAVTIIRGSKGACAAINTRPFMVLDRSEVAALRSTRSAGWLCLRGMGCGLASRCGRAIVPEPGRQDRLRACRPIVHRPTRSLQGVAARATARVAIVPRRSTVMFQGFVVPVRERTRDRT